MPIATSTATQTPTPVPHFVVGNKPFRFVGAFAPGWIWQNEFWSKAIIDDYFASAKTSGINVIHVMSPQYESELDLFRESELQKIDYFLDSASRHGVYVLFPFIHGFLISIPDADDPYYHPRGVEGLIKDELLRQAFKHHIDELLNRKNTVNGKLYREDSTILGWMVIEDPVPNPANYQGELPHITIPEFRDWLEDMAAYIKSIDSQHLVGVMIVSSVDLLTGAHEWTKMLDAPSIDFIEGEDTDLADLHRLNRPFIILTTNRYLGPEEEICKDYPRIANGLSEMFSQNLNGGADGVLIYSWGSDLYTQELPFDQCFNFTDSMEPIHTLLLKTANELNVSGYPFPPLDFVNISQ